MHQVKRERQEQGPDLEELLLIVPDSMPILLVALDIEFGGLEPRPVALPGAIPHALRHC